jgi:tripartite ATP-independent transporter DctM subunit
LIALPTMLKAGYRPSLAVGTIAAASTLGILIPPSILLVFLSELLQISVGYLFAGAIYPGLLLASLYMLYIIGYTFFVPGAAPRLSGPEHKLPTSQFISVLVKGIIPPVILIFIIMGSVLSGLATITESAAFGAGGACLLAWLRGNLGFAKLRESLQRSAMTVGMVFVLFIGATSFAYVFRALGGDDIVLWLIDAFDYGPWSVLGLVIFLIFLLGFFFDVLEILLIAMPIFGPIVAPLEFPGHILTTDVIYWFAILVAVTLQTSFLTPPMGIALFYIKGVAPDSVKMRDIYVGIIPFVALQMICVGIVMAFPDLVMDLPHRLLD